MSAPLAMNTADGTCWVRRAMTRDGQGLYAIAGAVAGAPDEVLATLAELAEYGIVGSADVLPVPVGPEPQRPLLSVRTRELVEMEADRNRWKARAAELEAQRERRRARLVALQNDALNMRGALSPMGEDRKVPFALGETLTPAVEWLISRVAELEATQGTVYRASHESIVMGLYTTAAAARAHCEADMRRDLPSVSLDWIEDEEDGVAELVAAIGEEERSTGFVVTALEVASEYDEEADE
ncbi:hypothetical protein [Streptomyces broussonetiae]|uniref:Uncharacterized protein n=1 Tax=Streptomyces broussonetiae TaxID=2686304 RepID=A0ABV5E5N9_9ACTN